MALPRRPEMPRKVTLPAHARKPNLISFSRRFVRGKDATSIRRVSCVPDASAGRGICICFLCHPERSAFGVAKDLPSTPLGLSLRAISSQNLRGECVARIVRQARSGEAPNRQSCPRALRHHRRRAQNHRSPAIAKRRLSLHPALPLAFLFAYSCRFEQST